MKGGNFCGFLFTSLGKETLPERVILLQNQGYIFREAHLQGGIVSDLGGGWGAKKPFLKGLYSYRIRATLSGKQLCRVG